MSDSKIITWAEFTEKLTQHFGDGRRLQTNFCDLSPFSLSSLQHWRRVDRVPMEAYEYIDKIDAKDCVFTSFKGFHSTKFTSRVVELSNSNFSLSAIAETLGAEFGRKVSENMIKGVRFRNKEQITKYRTRDV